MTAVKNEQKKTHCGQLEVLKITNNEEFQKCFQQWEKRWYQCIEIKPECFEGDWSCDVTRIKPNKQSKIIIPVTFGFPLVFIWYLTPVTYLLNYSMVQSPS